MKTYWMCNERGFANEFCVGLARDACETQAYKADDLWRRVTRDDARSAARRRGDDATEMCVGYRVGDPADPGSLAYKDEWLAEMEAPA